MAVERTHEAGFVQPMWAGDADSVRRLVRLLGERHEQVTAWSRELDAERHARAQGPAGDWQTTGRRRGGEREGRAARPAAEVKLALETDAPKRLRSGGVDEVLEAMDPAVVEHMRLEVASPGSARTTLIFGRWGPGCEARIEGPSRAWVAGTRAVLAEELERGLPWWARLRAAIRSLWCCWAIWVLLLASYLTYAHPEQLPVSLAELVTRTVVAAAGLWALLWVTITIALPRFELLAAGHRGRGDRAIGILGAMALAAAGMLVGALLA